MFIFNNKLYWMKSFFRSKQMQNLRLSQWYSWRTGSSGIQRHVDREIATDIFGGASISWVPQMEKISATEMHLIIYYSTWHNITDDLNIKLISAHLLKKLFTLYWMRRFMIMFIGLALFYTSKLMSYLRINLHIN
jgi:hypothetical protein